MKHLGPVLAVAIIAIIACSLGLAQGRGELREALQLLRSGQAQQAAQALAELVAREPNNLGARFWLGRALMDAGRVDEAIDQWRIVLKKKPGSVDTRYWLAVGLAQTGDTASATRELQEVLRRDPSYKAARQALAELKKQHGQPKSSRAVRPPRPKHSRLMIDLGDSNIDLGAVDILSRNVFDYTFASAPTDWYIAGGLWGTTNRWTCSPQWSWFGGMADLAPAVVWNKHVFAGDITVDMYAAWGMIYGYGPRNYKNPNDFCISICADGADLFSGYTFIVGGWRNERTAIMRQGKILAQTSDKSALPPVFEDGMPGAYEHHRKWWGIRARKVGNLLELYMDNKLVLQATDPRPLESGRVALWCYDNRIVLARVRIYYEALAQRGGGILPPTRWAVRTQTTAADGPLPQWNSPCAVGSSFETTAAPVRPRQGSFTQVTLASPGAGGSARCLKVVNAGPGGTFGVDLTSQPVDLVKLPVLAFDYKLTEQAKINLYVEVDNKLYEIVFAGRHDPAPLATIIGQIPDVEADGRWHHASVDLLGLVKKATGAWNASQLIASAVWFGNLNERDYLLAGLGGNQAGTVWCLDNVFFVRPVPKTTIPPPAVAGKKVKAVAWAVDRQPATEPERDSAKQPEPAQVAPSTSGWWWAHAAVQLDDDTWFPAVHTPVAVDLAPPKPVLVSPQPGSTAGDEDIVVALNDDAHSAIDWASVEIKIGGKTLKPGSEGVRVEPEVRRVVVDPALVGLSFDANKSVEVEVMARDVAGNEPSGPQKWAFTYAPDQDSRPPRIIAVEAGVPYLVDADFEGHMPPFASYSGQGGAVLTIDTSTAASGRASLRLSNPTEAGRFGVRLVPKPFDAGKYRLVSFDYRISPHYRADFAVYVNGDWKAIQFADTRNDIGYIGKVEPVIADGRWHHAEFDLYQMLVKSDPQAPSYVVRYFVLSDWGPIMSNFRRRQVWLDNFQITPVTSGLQPIKINVQAADPSGIAGIAWVLDQISTAAAPWKINAPGSALSVKAPGEGVWWLHCRVADKAGNLSEPVSRRLVIDAKPPIASIIAPPPGSHSAQSEVSIALLDAGVAGIDPASIVLQVGGKSYTCQNPGLVYDAAARRLTWNCERVKPQPVVFDDGQTVQVKLVKAADYAGNSVEQAPEWQWVMDYRMDNTPPAIAAISSPTHKTFVTQTFNSGTESWASPGGKNGAKVALSREQPADGSPYIELTQTNRGGLMQAYVLRATYYAEAYPIISFDYNFDPGVHMDLALLCNGQWFYIALTDNPAGAIGRIPGVVADGKWHRASIDVYPLLRRHIRRGSLAVTRIIVGDRNRPDNPPGAKARFDNFVIAQVGKGPVKVAWRATDATGIKGYSYVLDRSGATEPDTQAETKESVLSLGDLAPGLWYLHVRAQDGAGNWGPAAHYAIINRRT